MENILIIYTHPNHDSLNYSLLESTIAGLDKNPEPHQHRVLDLYDVNFDPVLRYDMDNRRRDMHVNPETKAYRDLIVWADHLVFIYPIFWGRPPAMLLGFIDRVFASGFAYKSGKGFQVEGLLRGKKVTCISTMKGPRGYIRLFLNNAHKVLMKKAVFNYVGMKKVRFFEFGSMENKGKSQEKALIRTEKYFLTI